MGKSANKKLKYFLVFSVFFKIKACVFLKYGIVYIMKFNLLLKLKFIII